MTTQLRPLSEVSERAHMEWLSKTETAKLKNGEMTVLSYGYLSQAVTEAIIEERDTAYTLLREQMVKKSCDELVIPDYIKQGGFSHEVVFKEGYNAAINTLLTLLDHIYGKTDALTK